VLRLVSQLLDRFPRRNTQDDPGPLDLEPGERSAPEDVLQGRGVKGGDQQGPGFSSAHRATPVGGLRDGAPQTGRREFLALLRARDT